MRANAAIKGGMLLLVGQLVGQACIFVRNVLIARLIGSYNFGIGSTFLLTASLMEMMSNVSLDKFLIQAADGEDPALLQAAHLVQFGRGFAGAIVIFCISGFVSQLFGTPETAWAFRCLALVPLIGAFRNLDPYRFQRAMNFKPELTVEVSHQIVSAACGVFLAWALRDYTAVLWTLVLQWGVWAAVSNLVAERRYWWSFDIKRLSRIISFGWPLLINGLLMFLVFQGDRLVVGVSYDMKKLGVYAVAFGLVLLPSVMLVRVLSSLFLPILARARRSDAEFLTRCGEFAECLSGAGALLGVGFIVAGQLVVNRLYGQEYQGAGRLVGILGVAQALWVIRTGPTSAALAKADGVNSMFSNLMRASALACSAVVAMARLDILWIPICTLVGEVLALLVSIALCRRTHRVPIHVWIRPTVLAVAVMAFAAVLNSSLALTEQQWLTRSLFAVAIVATTGCVMAMLQPNLRRSLRKFRRSLPSPSFEGG